MEGQAPQQPETAQAPAPKPAPEQTSPSMIEAPEKHHFVAWIVVLVIGVAIIATAGYYMVKSGQEQAPADVIEKTEEVAAPDETAEEGVSTNPFEGTSDNPFDDVEVNPFEGTSDNPFDDVDYNPFN